MNKSKWLILVLAVLNAQGLGADSARFTERYVETLVAESLEGEVFYDVTVANGVTFNATLIVPGIGATPFTGNLLFELTLGSFFFSHQLIEANTLSATTAVFTELDEDFVPITRVTVSRGANTLTVSGVSSDLLSTIVAEDHLMTNGSFSGTRTMSIQLGEFQTNLTVYYKGRNLLTHRTVTSNGELRTYDLNNIQVTGAADFTAPTVLITSPLSRARVTNSTLVVRGKASDNVAVGEVRAKVNEGAFAAATGTTNWTTEVPLVPGTNVIMAQSFDLEGRGSRVVSVPVFSVVPSPLMLTSNGSGRVMGPTNGQLLEVGRGYKFIATAGPNFLFSHWSGDLLVSNATLNFIMESNLTLVANFVTNRFIPLKGTFNGLFYDTNEVRQETSGFFTMNLTDRGGFTARLVSGARIHAVSGKFDLTGFARLPIRRLGTNDLTLELRLDLSNGTERVTGTVASTNWMAELVGDHVTTNVAPYIGTYTLRVPGTPGETNCPAGDGAGAVSVYKNGKVLLRGTLADGTPITQTASVSKHGEWPLYAPLYAGKGAVLSWVSFLTPADQLSGQLTWIKPQRLTDKFYRNGFSKEVSLAGARYRRPEGVTNRVLTFTNGVVELTEGNLAAPLQNSAAFVANNRATGSNSLVLTIELPSGLFSGTVRDPATAKTIPFKGAILQSDNAGSGFFLGTNQSGRVTFQAAAPPE